jgi:hypothetical protein
MEFARADGGALVCPVPPHPLPIRLKQKSSREEDAHPTKLKPSLLGNFKEDTAMTQILRNME